MTFIKFSFLGILWLLGLDLLVSGYMCMNLVATNIFKVIYCPFFRTFNCLLPRQFFFLLNLSSFYIASLFLQLVLSVFNGVFYFFVSQCFCLANCSLCLFASLGKEIQTKTGRLISKNFFMVSLTWWEATMKKVTILHINTMTRWRPLLKNCLLSLIKIVMGTHQRYISHMNIDLWMMYTINYLHCTFLSQILVRCRTTTCNWKTSPIRAILCETTSRLHHITGIHLAENWFLFNLWEMCLFALAVSFDVQIWVI